MIQNAMAKKIKPINVKTSVITIVFKKGSVGIIYLPNIQSARNGKTGIRPANDERRPATLHVWAYLSPIPERRKRNIARSLQIRIAEIVFSLRNSHAQYQSAFLTNLTGTSIRTKITVGPSA